MARKPRKVPAISCRIPRRDGQVIYYDFYATDGKPKRLQVKRVRGSWFLKIEGTSEHARWADYKRDACEDIAHFRVTGALPRGKQRW